MITFKGTHVFPGNGTPPTLYDIGWGLARTARFAGQTRLWYSVLPHVFAVADIVSPDAKFHALNHDDAEAILGDQVATWKNDFTKADEAEILQLVYQEHDLDWVSLPREIADEVHAADIACRSAETILLGHNCPNADFFQEIRMANPDLFQAALDSTQKYMLTFTPELCINETDWCAKEFVREVTHWLPHAQRIQEARV